MNTKREAWVDYVKVIACILVVLGHFFQSMVKASILPKSELYKWFDTTIYYFHVPLFFICSGYLYQRYSSVINWKSWLNNIWKKAIVLGVPYFIFSLLTWVIKTIFADVTSNAIGGVWSTLFVNPYPPYWYLYILFLIFFFTPTVKSKKLLVVLVLISFMAKIICCFDLNLAILNIYAVQGIMSNEIWFVAGMCLAILGAEKLKHRLIGVILLVLFFLFSISTVRIDKGFVEFFMAIIACTGIFMLMIQMKENKWIGKISPFTMPIFLMHTLTAAPVRMLLLRVGVHSPVLHVLIGVLASVGGPIVVYITMKKIKVDFIVFPWKYIKKKA